LTRIVTQFRADYSSSVPNQPPEQQAPPVQRMRIRYAKRGRLRFTSHRDFSRAFERAVFRARLPMSYSSGFNPHPRISYAGAAPTGSASEAEYLEIALAEEVTPEWIEEQLRDTMPDGLDILEVVTASGGSLADRLTGSRWRIETDAAPDAVAEAVERFLAQEEVLVERMTKKGLRQFDSRAAVVRLHADGSALDLVLRHLEPAVRPDDVLSGLRALSGLETGPAPLLTRLAQGALDSGTGEIADPLA
jgi:radical SAM-linked protein